MRTPSPGATSAAAPAGERARLVVYAICLTVALVLLALSQVWRGGGLFLLTAGLCAAGVLAGAFLGKPVLRVAVLLAGLLALAGLPARGDDVTGVGPAALVLLFASRIWAQHARQVYVQAWREPLRQQGQVALQSTVAAVFMGGFLGLAFEQVLGFAAHPAAAQTPIGILVSALQGGTVVHRALVFLFCAMVAFLAEAWWLYRGDRTNLASLRGIIADDKGANVLTEALAARPGDRVLLLCLHARDRARPGDARSVSYLAMSDFHLASRRFIKGLVPMLPLLGFVGTVIGLSLTLAQLPHDMSDSGQVAFDIGASLGGLAIKFETTLLGLAFGMIVSTLIALLEKAELELAAECALLVASMAPHDDRP